jgi:hypothetical protein
MSHSLQKLNVGNNAFVVAKIIDYPAGGEAFTLAELGITSLVDLIFLLNNSTFNGNGPIPILSGAKVLLTFSGGSKEEIPPQIGINFIFVVIAIGSN